LSRPRVKIGGGGVFILEDL